MHAVSVYACVPHWDRSAALYYRQQVYHGVAYTQGYVFYGILVLYPLNQTLLSFTSHSQTVATVDATNILSSKCTRESSS